MSQGEIVLIVIGVLVLIGNVVTAWMVITGQPTKIDGKVQVIDADEFVDVEDHNECIARLERSDTKLETDIGHLGGKIDGLKDSFKSDIGDVRKTLQDDATRRAGQINGRVDGVSDQVARVDERSQNTNQRVVLLDAKVDRLLERFKA